MFPHLCKAKPKRKALSDQYGEHTEASQQAEGASCQATTGDRPPFSLALSNSMDHVMIKTVVGML